MKLPFLSLAREWMDLIKFRGLPPEARSIVFYAEDGGSWVHFQEIVEEIVGRLGKQVCYVTSSPYDPVLQRKDHRILTFCVGFGAARISFFRTLQADVMVLTMPDIETFHIKRSVNPVHYVYVHHSIISTHMAYRPAAFDHFDSILCVGPHHEEEIRAREAMEGLNNKVLVEHGYGRLDNIIRTMSDVSSNTRQPSGRKRVLIAPSWGKDTIFETCGADLIEVLLASGYHVTVRPHPVTARNSAKVMAELFQRFGANPEVQFDSNVASQDALQAADIMISDWSGVALEFAFGMGRPVLFVDVPKKINNPDFERLGCEPLEVMIRTMIGAMVSPLDMEAIPGIVEQLCADPEDFAERMKRLRNEWVFNIGTSGAVGAGHIYNIADRVLV